MLRIHARGAVGKRAGSQRYDERVNTQFDAHLFTGILRNTPTQGLVRLETGNDSASNCTFLGVQVASKRLASQPASQPARVETF